MNNNKLTITSRILVAFASGALIAVFFLPTWRIDLFAPQYPEGLTMKIWISGLSGDVDIINGLNHYIGMKHISVAMFPEFKFLPYVVAFFMLLGLVVAVTGKRKFLFFYLVFTAIGGAAAIYDFYRWCYNYGHNLDPKAPIQVPGMSYQPPLIGHKRLLNFDAYSFPDVAGWIVAAAGALAFVVWFVEWGRHHKTEKLAKKKITPAIAIAASVLILLSSCSAKPEPMVYGKDICYSCKMGMADPKFGGEVITKKGKVYKFDDLHCMISFLRSGFVAEKDIRENVVINYEIQNDFLDVQTAKFVISPLLKSPMGSNTAGFASKEAAQINNSGNKGQILNWNDLLNQPK